VFLLLPLLLAFARQVALARSANGIGIVAPLASTAAAWRR
jgi:hypothetical protein